MPLAAGAPPLLLGGIVVGGLANATPAGKLPAAALFVAGLGLGAGALWSLQAPLDTPAAISDAARWNTLTHRAVDEVGDLRWALHEAPRWHALADRLPVEDALAVGWQSERAPLAPQRRVAAAKWLEANERGGEALRLLRHGDDPQSRWWRAYYRRAAGQTVTFSEEGWRPGEAVGLPLGPLLFATNREETAILSLDAPASSLEVTASAEWFEGPPTLVVELDGAIYHIQPERSPRRYRLPQPLQAGPHRLRFRYETDRFAPGQGDRNIYVHRVQVAD